CFRDAEERGITDFSQCTLFVSLEPCSHYGKTPPCAKLIIEKGVKKVVVGMLDPNPLVAGKGIAMLREAGIEVEVGVMEEECRKLNKRFLMLHEHHRPYVILKWAETLDGYIDRYAERPLVISTPVTKQLVHKMRAENMAIMVGTNTVIKDNPKLNVTRWVGRNPIRVTVDRHGRIGKEFHILDDSAETIVYRDNTDWSYIVSDLAKRGIHSIMVEGGTTLLNHILETGIYDEIHIEVSDVRIGEGVAAPKIELPNEYEIIDNHRIYCIYK
ncbi:MAG: bifunctional diaminohydroxyphosphoribosylaminopyrimidine deaminase/5-amino-6-(5-phosphoribosylamino)uracil reductase RibD, partial [Paludibacteraceae bacterium]|nr:bifunctional diaminohydroxyphosphoribosylaminopyrimidine deaminase/5-amino-6-(5-phosphoribosylamino)uracil reductase RibD [Paludibacteraceae bacterium]